jgi:asparagine synthase (glutamine-hydrolysing)
MDTGLQQLLRYADRNSMAHSREVRLPFLYHELVEFLFSLPPQFKIKDGWTKWIMRQSFSILPDAIRWRRDKIGYEPPQKRWMENDTLKEKIRNNRKMLVDKHICSSNILKQEVVASNAMDADNLSWKHLMGGELFL